MDSTNTHLDRFAAIKVLPAERAAAPDRKARFAQEATAASALNHPNIITIYEISADSGGKRGPTARPAMR